jgi:hypothetical protein
MNRHVAAIGTRAGVLATVSGLGYIIALLLSLAGVLTGPRATFWQLAPSIVLAWSFMVLIGAVVESSAPERRVWALIGFGFSLIYATINSIVYFAELTVVIPHVAAGQVGDLSVLLFEPGKFLFAINGLAYFMMSMAALFASAGFVRDGFQGKVRWAMVAHGVIGPAIAAAVVQPVFTYIGALWIITFPVMSVMLTMLYSRRQMGSAA